MAVYTQISDNKIQTILEGYDLGKIEKFEGIAQGIENTNYLLQTDKGKYIFTIFENRINTNNLPFYMQLQEYLQNKNYPCPNPVKNNEGEIFSYIDEKPFAIVSFLLGKQIDNITSDHTRELGRYLARLHVDSSGFKMECRNEFSLSSWYKNSRRLKSSADKFGKGLAKDIDDSVDYLSTHWPRDIQKGIIHADLFPDNVFFENDKITGVIDFYFACNDFLMYDVAVCLNAWCFDQDYCYDKKKAKALFEGYSQIRKLSDKEIECFPAFARGAAVRFLLTRLNDWYKDNTNVVITPKDPMEYWKKLKFHTQCSNAEQYGF